MAATNRPTERAANQERYAEPQGAAGVTVTIVFTDDPRLTVAECKELMQNVEAFLTVGMGQSYEVTRPKARAKLGETMVVRSISKSSPLEIVLDLQAAIPAVASFLSLATAIVAFRPSFASYSLKAAAADAERERQKLKKKIIRDLNSQYDDLSKKKKRKLLSDKRFMALVDQAAEGAMIIESITSDLIDVQLPTLPKPSVDASTPKPTIGG